MNIRKNKKFQEEMDDFNINLMKQNIYCHLNLQIIDFENLRACCFEITCNFQLLFRNEYANAILCAETKVYFFELLLLIKL